MEGEQHNHNVKKWQRTALSRLGSNRLRAGLGVGLLVTVGNTIAGVAAGRRLLAALLEIASAPAGLEAVLDGLGFDLVVGELREFLGSADVAHVLAVALGEDDIDLLQTAASGLGVEQNHGGNEDGVHDGEEELGSPLDVGDHDGSDHDNSEVEQPVRAGRDGVGLGTSAQGRDLGWVQPRKRQPGGTEDGEVQEDTDGSTLGRFGGVGNQASENQNHRKALAHRAGEEELPTSNALNNEP